MALPCVEIKFTWRCRFYARRSQRDHVIAEKRLSRLIFHSDDDGEEHLEPPPGRRAARRRRPAARPRIRARSSYYPACRFLFPLSSEL